MATTMNAVQMMEQEEVRKASTPKKTGRPAFLFLKDGHAALIRSLVNLDQAAVMHVHHKYVAGDPKQGVNAVCAVELGKQCQYCEYASTDKTLRASMSFMLPVWVYRVTREENGQQVSVMMKDENGQDIPVQGPRIIELQMFGAIDAVRKALLTYFKEEESHDIRVCDFLIQKFGSGQGVKYVTMPKSPKPFTARVQTPTDARIREKVLEALPFVEVTSVIASHHASSDVEESDLDRVANF